MTVRARLIEGSFGRDRNWREIADSIGFDVVFPYMGFAIDTHEPG